jgi:hypothetical protein
MFDKIKSFWNKDPFLSLCVLCIIFIIGYGIYNLITKEKGKWSNSFYMNQDNHTPKLNKPKESKGEIECRRVLENIFNRSFTKDRPNFLNNPVTGGNFNLELDCYNPELKLAVEYNGIQHYKYTPYFHKNNEAFLNQKYRDELKRRMCKDNMITLIEVPYTVKVENIKDYLIKELFKHGYIMK